MVPPPPPSRQPWQHGPTPSGPATPNPRQIPQPGAVPPWQRPNRPRPSGRAGGKVALVVVALLLVAGVWVYLRRMGGGAGEPKVSYGGFQSASGEAIPTPLRARALAMPRGRTVRFQLHVTDANGRIVREVRMANGRQPEPPRIEVRNAAGQRIYAARLKYG